ncbi:hypothetical protein [Massilia timonae]|uniref:hypothetical protein n=1 Tax=Massilia timonae TaxID=47229 RepID=UPI0028AEE36E|nr:hypothetical protein [Massilia timonae]
MKIKAILAVILMALTASAVAQTHVRGYTKKDGTYVAPHYRSSPNSTRNDNYSTRGNVNPYTGKAGTKAPDNGGYNYTSPTPPTQPTYSQPTTIANPYGQPAPQPQSQSQYQPAQGY